uniref:beta-glucosidase n=1 Tax=Uromyces fabae TaxID=55588 RepID=Q70KQ7_UROFA|nr:beta glucosidase precursor [Uromyces viciae-fabae]
MKTPLGIGSTAAVLYILSNISHVQLATTSPSENQNQSYNPQIEGLTVQPSTVANGLRINSNSLISNFDFEIIQPPPGYEEWTSPVVLPAPVQSGLSPWSESIVRARAFVAQLTIEEKVNLTTGAGTQGRCVGETGTVPRLGFNQPICLQDGPVGIRYTDFNSVFPAAINVAATFDKQLMFKRAQAMAEEFRGKGANVVLAPMTNLMRTPQAGRAWEGYGSDPYLSGVATVQSVLGIQSTRASACVKHYIGNEQEHYRGGSGATASSSNIDDRTLRELYEWPFAEAIHAGVDYIMCSYNRVNQTYACENSKLINGIAKGEHKFQGVMVTDWAAAESGVRTALAGTDMNMPGFMAYGQPSEPNPSTANGSYWGLRMIEAVKNGTVPMERLDDMVTRVISTYYKQGQDKSDYPKLNFMSMGQGTPAEQAVSNHHVNVQKDHYLIIRQIATASTILLKNVNHTLPLKSPDKMRSVVVVGSDAGDNPQGPNSCVDRGCNRGILAIGWGSGTANFAHLTAPATSIQNYLLQSNPTITYRSIFDDYAYDEIAKAASTADVSIVHVSSDSGEGYLTVEGNQGDRSNTSLWNKGDELILKAAEACNNVVVVIHSVGPVDMEAWINHPNVTAVLLAGLPGQEAGSAEVDVLWGSTNPSGRLPYTIAKKPSDYPAELLYESNMTVPQINYSERLNIDYRHFDTYNIEPRFEFGFGLSYTTFAWNSLKFSSSFQLQKTSPVIVPPNLDLYQDVIEFEFQVTNSGPFDGSEVAQLYVDFPNQVNEPPKVLRGFERAYIPSKQSKTIEIKLRVKDLSFWDVITQSWQIPDGKFNFMIGSSSRKIIFTQEISLQHSHM